MPKECKCAAHSAVECCCGAWDEPQHTWVGLTDEEIEQLHTAWVLGGSFRKLCNSIEAKLKEKNT